MKLAMKNDYTFQRVSGYLDDPEMMSVDDVKAELVRWSETIGSWIDGDEVVLEQVVGLDGFLSALAFGEIEYEQPLKKYGYHAGFEYYDDFEVVAESQEKADEAAMDLFKRMKGGMPERINEAKGCFSYLEQFDPGYGCDKRIYED